MLKKCSSQLAMGAIERVMADWLTLDIYIMGKRYRVPEGLTIMTALKYSGYRMVRDHMLIVESVDRGEIMPQRSMKSEEEAFTKRVGQVLFHDSVVLVCKEGA